MTQKYCSNMRKSPSIRTKIPMFVNFISHFLHVAILTCQIILLRWPVPTRGWSPQASQRSLSVWSENNMQKENISLEEFLNGERSIIDSPLWVALMSDKHLHNYTMLQYIKHRHHPNSISYSRTWNIISAMGYKGDNAFLIFWLTIFGWERRSNTPISVRTIFLSTCENNPSYFIEYKVNKVHNYEAITISPKLHAEGNNLKTQISKLENVCIWNQVKSSNSLHI